MDQTASASINGKSRKNDQTFLNVDENLEIVKQFKNDLDARKKSFIKKQNSGNLKCMVSLRQNGFFKPQNDDGHQVNGMENSDIEECPDSLETSSIESNDDVDWRLGDYIGKGSVGTVYRALD